MLDEIKVYWIGGSPCCGKSTISEMLVRDFGFEMYKCDDYLERYTEIGFKNNSDIMKKVKSMNVDETLLRDVYEQIEDEFEFYRESFKIILDDLRKNYKGKCVLVEGAAILPELIKDNNIDINHYICIVPTREFQIDKYSKRTWINHYLKDCSDKKKAFENWMERDAEYAKIIKKQANNYDMNVLVVDSSKSIEYNYLMVKRLFNLLK